MASVGFRLRSTRPTSFSQDRPLRLGEHLQSLPETERVLWQQTIYYLHLLIFYRRPIDERQRLDQIVSENHPFLNIPDKEKLHMQSMAEHYIQQGIEKGFEKGIEKGIEQGIEEGETRTKREDILILLHLRFQNVPEPIAEKIRRLDDRNQLQTLFEKAATTNTLEELRTEINALTDDQ